VLRSKSSACLFEHVIDYTQATALYYALRPFTFPVPLTHSLLHQVIKALGGAAEEVVLFGHDSGTGISACHLVLRTVAYRHTVKCRFSDALAIAVTSDPIPIKVHRGFFSKRWGAKYA
jgi:bifunctional DNase/RNase